MEFYVDIPKADALVGKARVIVLGCVALVLLVCFISFDFGSFFFLLFFSSNFLFLVSSPHYLVIKSTCLPSRVLGPC